MVFVLIRCKKKTCVLPRISMKDIDTSLVVQRALDKKKLVTVLIWEGTITPKPYGMTFHSDCLMDTIFSTINHRVSSSEKNKNTETRFIGFSACHYKKSICNISL